MNFLAKVVSKEQPNTFKVLVNLDNIHALPIGNVGEKLVQYDGNMRIGSLVYIYDADLDSSTKRMFINKFTVINGPEAEGIEIPAEYLTLANLSDITPSSMMSEIYGLEDEPDEEDELQDSEDEAGDI